MALDPKQLKQGGKGGIKSSASSNLSGLSKVGGGSPPSIPPTTSTPAPIGEPGPSGGQLVPNTPTSLSEVGTPRIEKPVNGFRVYENLLSGPKSPPPIPPTSAIGTAAGIVGNAALFANAVSGGFSEPGDMRLEEDRDIAKLTSKPYSPEVEGAVDKSGYKYKPYVGEIHLDKSATPIKSTETPNTTSPAEIAGPPSTPGMFRQDGNTLNLEVPGGGKGSITWEDGRKLSDTQLRRLGNTIAYNNSEEGQANFARNAELSEARYAAARPDPREQAFANLQSQIDGLTQAWNNAGTFAERSSINRRLETLIGAQTKLKEASMSADISGAKLGYDFRKDRGEVAFKDKQEHNKLAMEASKQINDLRKNDDENPDLFASILKQAGQKLTPNTLGLVFGDKANTVRQAKTPEEAGDALESLGLSKQYIDEYVSYSFQR